MGKAKLKKKLKKEFTGTKWPCKEEQLQLAGKC
jgi:hypothetical protein